MYCFKGYWNKDLIPAYSDQYDFTIWIRSNEGFSIVKVELTDYKCGGLLESIKVWLGHSSKEPVYIAKRYISVDCDCCGTPNIMTIEECLKLGKTETACETCQKCETSGDCLDKAIFFKTHDLKSEKE